MACCRLPHRSLLQAGQAKVSSDVTRADAVGLAAGRHRPKRQQAVAVQGAPHATLPVSLRPSLQHIIRAARDTRNRAENILRSAGNTGIGPLVDSSMGIININPANSTETSTEGNNDTTSYEKDIITIVRAEYKVN
ncbi:MAG: hypothetical protein WEB53_09265 [Akkermansiaceae bacterium]